jgi:anaerobic ribonucleoside-triphosphate reductase activating protein
MYYSGIRDKDTTNGIGFGVSLFVSGCRNHCEGCFNKETWDFKHGQEFTPKDLDYILELIDRPYVDFFSVLGGDPMEPENVETVAMVCKTVKEKFPNIKVYAWTGYYFEDIIKKQGVKSLLSNVDTLIDSPFILSERNLKLALRGSNNQRVIDVKKSLESGSVVLQNLETY